MNFDSDEKIIKDSLSTIDTPRHDIFQGVKNKINDDKPSIAFKRVVSFALIACFCFILSVGVMASTIPSFNKLLSLVKQDIALLLQPINTSSIDNGIKMEVVGAMNDDEMATIYITMKDLTGDRIDETLDIYDYSLAGAHMFNSELINYDSKSKTATLRIQANGGTKLNGGKVSFRISSFLSHKEIFKGVNTGVNLLDIKKSKGLEMTTLDMDNISGGSGNLLKEEGIIDILKPDKMNIKLPNIDFMYISNIGYIDDYLHIQTKWIGDGVDDHGYLYFVNNTGEKIDINGSNIYFGVDELGNAQYGREYVEYIFDVSSINLDEVKLMGYFVSDKNYTKGNWNTTFNLKSVGEEKVRNCDIKFDSFEAKSISISPMGITLSGSGKINHLEKLLVMANMKDGSMEIFNGVRSFRDGEDIRLKFTSSLPIDLEKVDSVSINGNVIAFQ